MLLCQCTSRLEEAFQNGDLRRESRFVELTALEPCVSCPAIHDRYSEYERQSARRLGNGGWG